MLNRFRDINTKACTVEGGGGEGVRGGLLRDPRSELQKGGSLKITDGMKKEGSLRALVARR